MLPKYHWTPILHASDCEPDAEYVDGEIEERPAGENEHSPWQCANVDWMRAHCGESNIRVHRELRVQTSATRFRVPDMAVLDRTPPTTPVATHPPLAVFEVLSPEDRLQRRMRKLDDYAQMGVPDIRVIDPAAGTFFRFEDGQLLRRSEFALAERGIVFATSEITALVE